MEQEEKISMEIVNPHAAGIDIGSRSHWVGIGQHEKDVREFGVLIKTYLKWQIGYIKTRLEPLLWKAQVLTGKISMPCSFQKAFM